MKKNKDLNIKKVLFIQTVQCIRTYKVAKALHEKGIQVDIVYTSIHPTKVYKGLKLPYTNIYKLIDKNEMIKFVNESDYDILYSSNEPDYLTVLFKNSNKPVVHDCHDMMSLRSDISENNKKMEYLANMKCDGNIYVNPSIKDIAVEKFGLKNKEILCLHSFVEKSQLPQKYYDKLSSEDKEIHCVYEGGLVNKKGHHRFLENYFLKLAEEKIHVHIYSRNREQYFKYLNEKSNNYIHCEGFKEPHELITEMTKYDIGLAVFNLTERNKTFLNTAFPNKIWDYLAAGLPILFADLMLFRNFAENTGVGEVLDLNRDIRKQVEEVLKTSIDKNLLIKKKWLMNEAADEIIDFLGKVKEKYYLNNKFNKSRN